MHGDIEGRVALPFHQPDTVGKIGVPHGKSRRRYHPTVRHLLLSRIDMVATTRTLWGEKWFINGCNHTIIALICYLVVQVGLTDPFLVRVISLVLGNRMQYNDCLCASETALQKMGILSHKCNIWSIIHTIGSKMRGHVFLRLGVYIGHSIGSSKHYHVTHTGVIKQSSQSYLTKKIKDIGANCDLHKGYAELSSWCPHFNTLVIWCCIYKLSILYEHITVNIFKSCVVLNRQRALYKSYLTNVITGHLPDTCKVLVHLYPLFS